jgi:hypothetical protein
MNISIDENGEWEEYPQASGAIVRILPANKASVKFREKQAAEAAKLEAAKE